MINVEAAGAVTGIAGFGLALGQAASVLPAAVENLTNTWIQGITLAAGLAVWWRGRRQRRQDEDRPSD